MSLHNLFLKVAIDMSPVDLMPQSGFDYSPYFNQLGANIDSTGRGYGTIYSSIWNDALGDVNIADKWNLSNAGTKYYRSLADSYKTWAGDNADFMVANRSNPSAIQAKFQEYANTNNLLPTAADFSKLGLQDIYGMASNNPNLAVYAGKFLNLNNRFDTQGFSTGLYNNMQTGAANYLANNSSNFRSAVRGPVTQNYLTNRLGDVGDFWSTFLGDVGGGISGLGSMLWDQLRKVSPVFRKALSNIQGHQEAADAKTESDAAAKQPSETQDNEQPSSSPTAGAA